MVTEQVGQVIVKPAKDMAFAIGLDHILEGHFRIERRGLPAEYSFRQPRHLTFRLAEMFGSANFKQFFQFESIALRPAGKVFAIGGRGRDHAIPYRRIDHVKAVNGLGHIQIRNLSATES